MAQKTVIELFDDLDGTPAQETIRFGWEGRNLVIDLTTKNADKLRKTIEPYAAAARVDEAVLSAPAPRRGRPAGSTSKGTRQSPSYPNEFTDNRHMFNEWLAEQGGTPARGRVAMDKATAFAEAIRGGWSPKK